MNYLLSLGVNSLLKDSIQVPPGLKPDRNERRYRSVENAAPPKIRFSASCEATLDLAIHPAIEFASEIISSWKQVSNVRVVGSGTSQMSTRPREASKGTWKTVRSAASRMCCGLSTMRQQRSFSSRPNW